jgi:hypothetical protein
MELHHPLRVGAMRPTPIIEIGCAAIGAAAKTGDGTGSVIVVAGGRKPI